MANVRSRPPTPYAGFNSVHQDELLRSFSYLSLNSNASSTLGGTINLPRVFNKKGIKTLENYKISNLIKTIVTQNLNPWPGIRRSERNTLNHILEMKDEGLNAENYKEYIGFMLYAEEFQEWTETKKHHYKSVQLRLQKKALKWFATFKLQGILDKNPNVITGDNVLLIFDGRRVFLRVDHVSGSQVFLNPSKLDFRDFGPNRRSPLNVTIQFIFKKSMYEKMFKSLVLADAEVINCLFPQNLNRNDPNKRNIRVDENDLYDKSIFQNKEQLQAVRNIVVGSSRSCPYIILGPPGTGKTSTVAEAILQVWKNIAGARIVVATPSNSAADVLAEKLLASGELTNDDIVRICSEHREDQINPKLDDITFFGCESIVYENKIIIVTLGMSANLHKVFGKDEIDFFFIDEAGQATEPELLLALSCLYHSNAQVILSGDPFQLGPVVRSHVAERMGLGMSPLERLINHSPTYAKNSNGNYCPKFITKLCKNYRSDQILLQVPNALFYENELVACADHRLVQKFHNWMYLPRKGFPLMFHSVKAVHEREANSPSSFNNAEAKLVLNYVKRLKQSRVDLAQIGVITPYRAQVRRIMEELTKFYGENMNVLVGSTEEFQGQERLVTIISTVRSTMRASGRETREIGFLANPKRFNVAITRAQALLIVIGDDELLAEDEMWGQLVSFCRRNNAIVRSSPM